ncbi:MAG: hypothetical protein HOB84_00155 [Candidatus Marinimicrobia bacterium]|jgi:hypothetical protein|nr:hypothetical protein [Candidatus Neomarinimicrobiota bacterium]MBT4361386.1 hypothetical protein [Candidatus Neomarinimicrobiota bacterium]MBT4713166.1 hypothetical protein [Candidatus Neomarinimicrobiota bacterium]MBT4947495.1 hypothetical protein [Candidatus Neomarinimicrobiota bacterium]MBT5313533.1 hypothetical protein [Candidatus Neomarinimicrobiota bacterium]
MSTIKRKTGILLLLLLFVTASLPAQGVQLSGYARSYTGILLNDANGFSILQNTFNLNIEDSRGNVAFKVNPYIYHYSNEDLTIGLREAYLDIFFDSMDLRLGKQQIIWGKADGVFITDVISPKDLSEFLLRDFEEIRMGITALKADYYIGNSALELVWAPAFTSTKLAEEASLWGRTPEFESPIPGVVPTLSYDYSQKAVPATLENSEAFVKFSGVSSFIDYEVMGGYIYDDDPTMHVTVDLTPDTNGVPQPQLTLTPQHHRLSLMGGSTSMDIMGYVVRTELAYYAGKNFQANQTYQMGPMSMTLPSALEEKDYLHYLVGLDFSIGSTKLSTQFIQEYVLDYDESIIQEEISNMSTFLINRMFMNDLLTLQLFAYYDITNEDALVRPTVSYDLADGFEILGGANIFMPGVNNDYLAYFGYYDDNDMLYLKLKYSF